MHMLDIDDCNTARVVIFMMQQQSKNKCKCTLRNLPNFLEVSNGVREKKWFGRDGPNPAE